MNHAIASNLCFATDVRMRRVNKSYAFIKHQAPNRAAPQKVFELGEFGASVDARDFARVSGLIDADCVSFVSQDPRDISQVILALLVHRFDTLKRRKKLLAFKAVDARVDFANLALVLSGILMLNYLYKASGFVPHDAAIAGGILQAHRKHRARSVINLVLLNQFAQRLNANHWDVAREDENRGVSFGQGVSRRHHRIAGAALFQLVHKPNFGVSELAFNRSLYFFGLIANDDVNHPRIQTRGGSTNVDD